MKLKKSNSLCTWVKGSLAFIVLMTAIPLPSQAQGSKGGGGGFVNYEVDKALLKFRDQVVTQLEESAIPMFDQYPERKRLAISGLVKIQLRAGTRKFRNNRELMFDYDLAKDQIIVLKPYWDLFGPKAYPDFQSLVDNSDASNFTNHYLLREVAHFWNQGSDLDSDDFAKRIERSYKKEVLVVFKGFVDRAQAIADANLSNDEFDRQTLQLVRDTDTIVGYSKRIHAIEDSHYSNDGTTSVRVGGLSVRDADYHASGNLTHGAHVAFMKDLLAHRSDILHPMFYRWVQDDWYYY